MVVESHTHIVAFNVSKRHTSCYVENNPLSDIVKSLRIHAFCFGHHVINSEEHQQPMYYLHYYNHNFY